MIILLYYRCLQQRASFQICARYVSRYVCVLILTGHIRALETQVIDSKNTVPVVSFREGPRRDSITCHMSHVPVPPATASYRYRYLLPPLLVGTGSQFQGGSPEGFHHMSHVTCTGTVTLHIYFLQSPMYYSLRKDKHVPTGIYSWSAN